MTDVGLVIVVLLVIALVVYAGARVVDRSLRTVRGWSSRVRAQSGDTTAMAAFSTVTRERQAQFLGLEVRDMRWYGR